MIVIRIDPGLRAAASLLCLGVLQAKVKVSLPDARLWVEVESRLGRIAEGVRLEDVAGLKEIRAVREAYKSLGKEPGRYRSSSEALVRRILQKKGLYPVNTVVDIGNLISLETFHPVCVFDLARINPPVAFTVGRPGQTYSGIGKGEINIAGLPVFVDREGPFGSPTSDSERTKVTRDTKNILFMILSFSGPQGLDRSVERARMLLETYAGGMDLETALIQ